MIQTSELYTWVINALFILGVLLVPLGVCFILIPDKIFKVAGRLNRWIETDAILGKMSEPIYTERFFYRYNRILGAVIVVTTVLCLYMLMMYSGTEAITASLLKFAQSPLEKWLFVTLYYLLIVAVLLALVFGIIVLVRPSALKSIEKWGNRWINVEQSLKVLDKSKDLPDRILPGNPRIFGAIITLAAFYIIWSTFSQVKL